MAVSMEEERGEGAQANFLWNFLVILEEEVSISSID